MHKWDQRLTDRNKRRHARTSAKAERHTGPLRNIQAGSMAHQRGRTHAQVGRHTNPPKCRDTHTQMGTYPRGQSRAQRHTTDVPKCARSWEGCSKPPRPVGEQAAGEQKVPALSHHHLAPYKYPGPSPQHGSALPLAPQGEPMDREADRAHPRRPAFPAHPAVGILNTHPGVMVPNLSSGCPVRLGGYFLSSFFI